MNFSDDRQSNQPFDTRLVEVLNKSAPDPCDITMTPAPRYVEIDDPVGSSQTVWTYGTNWAAQGHPQMQVAWTINWGGKQIPNNWYQCENVPAVASCVLGGDVNNVPTYPVWISVVSSIDLPTGVSYSFDYDISGSGWGAPPTTAIDQSVEAWSLTIGGLFKIVRGPGEFYLLDS